MSEHFSGHTAEQVAGHAEALLARVRMEGVHVALVELLRNARSDLNEALKKELGEHWMDDERYDDLFRRITEVVDPKPQEIPKDPFKGLSEKYGMTPPRWHKK